MTEPNNLRIWSQVERTDPGHTKKVNQRGGFTAISAQYQIMRATETFGPIGEGWGYDAGAPIFQEGLVFVPVTLWQRERSNVFGPMFGGAEWKSNGRLDSDALKKATTDALTKLLSQLGFNADVFMGKFDDNKYVAEVKAEFAGEPKKTVGGTNPTIDIHTDGPDWYYASGSGMSAAKAKAEGWGETLDGWLSAIPMIPTMEAWRTWCRDRDDEIKALPMGWRKIVREAVDARKAEL
ncbi:hypothetical protein UFOVP679_37 [uncultured Caudovirales phage]|uniref:Uncharacterized protein n=1 Tax=uncultured Caudovirales phage TaxID=2100421 RepID=A0A6J5NFW5_9CAUD|nr:hypothetical protein UFOVP679_37 [uncultured Caudovirales phage]